MTKFEALVEYADKLHRKAIIYTAIVAIVIYAILSLSLVNNTKSLREQLISVSGRAATLESTVKEQDDTIEGLQNQITMLHDYISSLKQTPQTSRGVSNFEFRVTAYDLSYASCGKRPSHPLYGITAAGTHVKQWYTVAAGPEIPLGTRVYIPFFKDKPNGGLFVVEDRGSAIVRGCIDVYMPSNKDCMDFGVKQLDVYVLR